MIRIGLVGAGFVTEHHLDGYAALADRARVAAIADPSGEARRKRARQYDIPAEYESAAAMLDAEALDAIDVAAPREHHAEIVALAAARGLPVICQKPLAPTFKQAVALVGSLPGDTRLMVHENWRFRPHYRQIKRWLDEGLIGEVAQAHMLLFTSGLVADTAGRYPAIERQPFMAGESRLLLMEVMIHHTDTMRFLLGDLMLNAAQLSYACPDIRGESGAMLNLKTTAGAGVSLIGNFVTHGAPAQQLDDLLITGTQGSIRLDNDRLTLTGAHCESQVVDLPTNYKASYRNAIAHFLDCVGDGSPFETAPSDNLRTLELVEEGYALGGERIAE